MVDPKKIQIITNVNVIAINNSQRKDKIDQCHDGECIYDTVYLHWLHDQALFS